MQIITVINSLIRLVAVPKERAVPSTAQEQLFVQQKLERSCQTPSFSITLHNDQPCVAELKQSKRISPSRKVIIGVLEPCNISYKFCYSQIFQAKAQTLLLPKMDNDGKKMTRVWSCNMKLDEFTRENWEVTPLGLTALFSGVPNCPAALTVQGVRRSWMHFALQIKYLESNARVMLAQTVRWAVS